MIIKKKLVVYSAANAHGYITCIVHRLLYNSTAKAIIVLDKYVPNTGAIYFDGYIPFPRTTADGGTLNHLSSDELKNYIIDFFDNKLNEVDAQIQNIDEVYTGSYWSDFPLYLNLKNKKHYMFQEAVGDICWPMKDYIKKMYPSLYAVQSEAGIYGYLDNKNIILAYFHKDTIAKAKYHPKCIEYDVNQEIYKLPEYMRVSLLNTFNVPLEFSNKHNSLILTQWWAYNGKKWVGDEPIKMFALLCDMYGVGSNMSNIYIKKHPADKNDYKPYFNNVIFLNEKFPSEMLGLVKDIHFDRSITISSSSIDSVRNLSAAIYSIKDFKIFYPHMLRIFMTLIAMKQLGYKCFYYGIFSEEIIPVLRINQCIMPDTISWFDFKDNRILESNSVLLINDYLWKESQKNLTLSDIEQYAPNSIVFLISDDIRHFICSMHDKELKKCLSVVKLKKEKNALNSIFDEKEEYIYIFNKAGLSCEIGYVTHKFITSGITCYLLNS